MLKLSHFKKRTDRALLRYDSIPSFRCSDQYPYRSLVLVQRGDRLMAICEKGEYQEWKTSEGNPKIERWSEYKRIEYELNQLESEQWQQILSGHLNDDSEFEDYPDDGSEITITLFSKPKNTKIHWWTYGPPEHQILADFIDSFLDRAFPEAEDNEDQEAEE